MPSWAQSSEPGTPGARSAKDEPQDEPDVKPDIKRVKTHLMGNHGMYQDTRTAAIDLLNILRKAVTMRYEDAYFRVQENSPGTDPTKALEILKGLERIEFNAGNQVFSYIPELTLITASEIRNHIRIHSTPTSGLPLKTLKEAMPNGVEPLKDLESRGDVMIMRGLGANFKDIPLPRLGRLNVNGEDLLGGPTTRWKMVFWDHLKEAGRAGKRVDDEFIFSWADVPIAETDDVTKLLADQELSASSLTPAAPKAVATAPAKKKKRNTRALKITNTHMKEQGIDFSKDYVKGA
ncbi:hypothetical protein B9479_005492 [Cryptococcus floricola]|uniref:TFA2 Winged helix domain-containing protein n=1 Tax=Cryptococcus floricola TaxID=2591691 RepID=A0A5D3AUI5_9TREE|nr:hypothetical protein B9479_005492 [Cryptococcus floricola]